MNSDVFKSPIFRIYGDSGLLVEFGDAISPEINGNVRSFTAVLEMNPIHGISEVVPAYRSLLIIYDPARTSVPELERELLEIELKMTSMALPDPEIIEIPVCYGGGYGPDIENVAAHNKLRVDEVIGLHSAPDYLIYMLGFTPGFPFLGGLPDRLITPRLETPRVRVPGGSVGIANNQTGIYPIESPGGWQLIGRTPVKLFDPQKKEPFLLKAGARLKFRPVSPDEFNLIKDKHTS
jgi:KipI family sensor histidine kinase inhibitor